MSGEKDLGRLLSRLSVSRRPGLFVVVTGITKAELGGGVEALIREPEGVSAVARIDTARGNRWDYSVEMAWLTLDVHSSLEAVGLTAAVATALTEVGIACNVLAGHFHDHLLVPVDRADDAVEAINALRAAAEAG